MDNLNQKLREDFPGLHCEYDGIPITYLDSAATSLKPKQMVDAMNRYYLGVSTNVHRGKSQSLESVSENYEQARYKVAELLNCSGNEVVFLRNTTEAINLVAQGLELSKSDKVLVFTDSHHSNFLPWMEKASISTVKTNRDGSMDLDHYYTILHERPKVVAITHCSNVTGVYCPLEDMVAAAKEVGAIVVVDGAQSVPHRKINVNALGIDFLTFSAHKMLGPTGMGVLFGKKDQLNALSPALLGGGVVDWVEADHYRLRKIPHRFEAGTPHIAGAYGLAAAIDYLNQIGFDQVEEHDKQLGQHLLRMAQERDYLKVVSPDPELDRGAVISMQISGCPELDDFARVLSDSYGLICRNGHLCAQPYVTEQASGQVLRVSGYVYSGIEDFNKFFAAMDELSTCMI